MVGGLGEGGEEIKIFTLNLFFLSFSSAYPTVRPPIDATMGSFVHINPPQARAKQGPFEWPAMADDLWRSALF